MKTLEERVSRLEKVLEDFIVSVGIEFNKLYNSQMRTEAELRAFKDEMRAFKNEMIDFKEEMKDFKDEMKAFKDEMKDFKDEMKDFKDEMKAFKDEMKDFKDEMKAFKDEMKDFKDEMRTFKDEMKDFKDEMLEFRKNQELENKRKNQEWSNLAKKMGTLYEDLIAPALRPVLSKYFNCDVILEGQRIYKKKDGQNYEVDAIAACEDKVFMIEVRSTPKTQYVDEIKEKSRDFFKFFPEFEGKKLYVIFGSIIFSEDLLRYISKKGIYAMGWREWEYMDILNYDYVQKKRKN